MAFQYFGTGGSGRLEGSIGGLEKRIADDVGGSPENDKGSVIERGECRHTSGVQEAAKRTVDLVDL